MMKNLKMLFFLLLIGLISSANAAVIGTDRFDYPDGSIEGQTGGTGWDVGGVSDWNVAWGTTAVSGGAVTTQGGGVIREFGADEYAGAVQATGQVYFGVTMTVTADSYDWGGISSFDFGTERVFFGCPGGQTVSGSGMGYYGIDNSADAGDGLTNIPIVKDEPARIVGCIDFDGQQLLLWVNPDADDYDNGGGDNSADLALSYTYTNWSSSVRVASGNAVEWDDIMVAGTFEDMLNINIAHDPLPAYGQEDVIVSGLELSWAVPQVRVQPDPNFPSELVVDPNLLSFNLYYTDTDPNLDAVSPISVSAWDTETLRASYIPSVELAKNSTCIWRVDSVMDDATVIEGYEWFFYTELTKPIILTQTLAQVVDFGSTANFAVVINSESPATFQWYKYVDGISDQALNDGGDISISVIDNGDSIFTSTLTIANAEMADEGQYYCITNNDAGIEVPSKLAPLAIKRKIAYWPFEDSLDSVISGSPMSVVVGDPNLVPEGIAGNAVAIDDGIDMLYTDPEQVSYFDICDYEMTVACWVKTTDSQDWCPLVAKNGEGQGWQLRQSGFTDDRPCFTTRGTGSDDGTPANRTIYDDQWHYVVATCDGTVKKVYIDGVVSRVYSEDDGSFVQDADEVSIPINKSQSPVAIAGRVTGSLAEENLNIETWNIVAGIYDEIEIYNYALDAATIAQTYANITGTDVCLSQVYDLDNDCVVNLNDLGMLASEWLNDAIVEPMP